MSDELEKPSFLSYWDVLMVIGLFGLGLLYALVSPALPTMVPTHYTGAGVANGWTPKEQLPWLIFGLPVGIWLLLLLIGAAGAAAQKDPALARASAIQPFRGFMSLGLSILMGSCLIIPLYGLQWLWVGLGLMGVCLILGIAFIARDMKALNRSANAANYRCGVFYVNPEDPRLWVEKRLGYGWTLNYARPAAWWVTVLLLLPAIVVPVLIAVTHH